MYLKRKSQHRSMIDNLVEPAKKNSIVLIIYIYIGVIINIIMANMNYSFYVLRADLLSV